MSRPEPAPSSRRWSASGRLMFGALAAVILGIPIGVGLLDIEADDPRSFSIAVWIGWIFCATVAAVVVVRTLRRKVSAPSAGLAMAYDALPVLLLGAWAVLIAALLTSHWLLASLAALLCAHHLTLVVPRFRTEPTPAWVSGAETFRVCVANVFIDNPTPELAAEALVASDADVVVIVESTEAFMSHFDRAGGDASYPHRVDDPTDTSDYAVTIVSRRPLAPESRAEVHGPLRVMRAVVTVDDREVTVLGVNPMASVDPGGYGTWRRQLRGLRRALRGMSGPVVLAGDLNTSRFRPEFGALLSLGLHDVHDTLGQGLRPSFKLSATGPLAAIGPVARLDHALTNAEVHPVEIEDLEANGSDHLPFVATLAVRPVGAATTRRRLLRRRR